MGGKEKGDPDGCCDSFHAREVRHTRPLNPMRLEGFVCQSVTVLPSIDRGKLFEPKLPKPESPRGGSAQMISCPRSLSKFVFPDSLDCPFEGQCDYQ